MKSFIDRVTATVFLCFMYTVGFCQTAADSIKLLDLSFEELMSVRIVSASKKDESLFDAPVTSYVITRNEIVNSGATSIPEALRLAPALIVREIANGSYDVSIRGGKDNLPSHGFFYANNSILAMIDNRIVYNYYSGGTYWQNLPIDLADIERIEIVYGPNAPLYGPNAVDGVINIITRRWQKGGDVYGSASVQAGESLLFSALGGKKISDQLEVNVSANHSNRKRMKTEYYDPATGTFITDLTEHSDPLLAANPNGHFPNPDLGSRKTGLNFNLHYAPEKRTNLSFNSTFNESLALTGTTLGSNFRQVSNASLSNQLRAEWRNFTFQTALDRGRMATNGNLSEFNYDYQNWDTYLDYNLLIGKKFSLRPSVSYQRASMNDEPYSVDVGRNGLFNGDARMYNYAGSLKADYSPFRSLRIVAALRADKFKAPNDINFSYQGIVTYKTGKKSAARILLARSFQGSFIEPTYLTHVAVNDPFMKMTVFGNVDRDLMHNDLFEVGYKAQFNKHVTLDISVFRQVYDHFVSPLTTVVREPGFDPGQQGEWHVVFENADLKSEQRGATLATTILIGRIALKPTVTYQRTMLTNYTPYNTAPHPVFAPVYNNQLVVDRESEFAPNIFGGFSGNLPLRKWNFNVSGYYYNRYQISGLNSFDFETGALQPVDIENIHGKFLLNANVSYNFSQGVKALLNGRNITVANSREAYGTDQVGTMLFAGVHIEF